MVKKKICILKNGLTCHVVQYSITMYYSSSPPGGDLAVEELEYGVTTIGTKVECSRGGYRWTPSHQFMFWSEVLTCTCVVGNKQAMLV